MNDSMASFEAEGYYAHSSLTSTPAYDMDTGAWCELRLKNDFPAN